MRSAGTGVGQNFSNGPAPNRTALFSLLPKLDPEDVAERAWRGFKSGRRLVVPGISAKLAVLVGKVLALRS